MSSQQLHDVDFYRWTQEQAALLRTMSPASCPLDLDNLAEEIEDMGKSEINKITSHLCQVLIHLLKLTLDPHAQTLDHWYEEVIREQADAVLAFSPGLRQRLDLEKAWKVACNGATRSLEKYEVAVPNLPPDCPFTLDQLLSDAFDPAWAVRTMTAAIQAAPGHRM